MMQRFRRAVAAAAALAEMSPMSRLMMPGLVAFALFAAGACSGGQAKADAAAGTTPSSAQTAPKIDPCALLTTADVESATGWKVTKSGLSKLTGACEFFGPNDVLDVVTVSVVAGPSPVATSADLAAWRKAQIGPKNEAGLVIQPVADVGVPAIRNDFGDPDLAVIEAWVRGRLVDIGSYNLAATKALVRAAVKRMP